MEKISDFFKELKERISSPLFFSFIVSWLIWNWRIPIALLFYKPSDLIADGYKSYFDVIEKDLHTNYIFSYPLLSALIYTLLYPFLRNCIEALNTYFRTRGTDWNIKISKGSNVPMSKYISLREGYKSRTQVLEKVLEEERSFNVEKEKLTDKITSLELESSNLMSISQDLRDNLTKWNNENNISSLNGEWIYTETHPHGHIILEESIYIETGLIFSIDKTNRSKGQAIYAISNFFHNIQTKELIFTMSNHDTSPMIRAPKRAILMFNYAHIVSLIGKDIIDPENKKITLRRN